jgi:hypothetical protein
MIIETKHIAPIFYNKLYDQQGPLAQVDQEVPSEFADFLQVHMEIHDKLVLHQLQDDVVEHLWLHKRNTWVFLFLNYFLICFYLNLYRFFKTNLCVPFLEASILEILACCQGVATGG